MKRNNRKNIINIVSLSLVLILIGYGIYNIHKGIEWKAGSQQLYRIEINTIIKNINLMTKAETSNIEKITGNLNFKIFSIDSGIVKAGLQFSELEIDNSGKRSEFLENIFSTFFLCEFKKDGTPIAFYFDNNIAKEDEVLISNIIREFQLVIPWISIGDWSTNEKDSIGEFTAEYSESGNEIIKKKMNYSKITQIAGNPNGNIGVNIIFSKLNIIPSVASSWIEQAYGKENIEMVFKNSDFVFMQASKDYSLEMIPFEPDMKLSIWTNEDTYDEIKSAFFKGEKNSQSLTNNLYEAYLRNKLKNENYNTVINKFLKGYGSRIDLKELLIDYLTIHPEEAYKTSILLKNSNIDQSKRIDVIQALSFSNTLKAQELLNKITNDNTYKSILRLYAVIGIGQMKYPTSDSVMNLMNISRQKKDTGEFTEDISNSAILALGSISYSLKGINENIVNDINGELISRLKSASTPAELSTIVLAMGNTKNEDFTPEIIPQLSSEDSNLRAMAAYSLRDMSDDKSLSSLLGTLGKEESTNVKDFILTSLSNRKASDESINCIKNAVAKENDKGTRYNMYKYLIANKDQYSSIEGFLRENLENGLSNKERVLIYKSLYSKKNKS